MEFEGARRLAPGVHAATEAAGVVGPGSTEVLLIATGVDGTTREDLQKATSGPVVNGSSNVVIHLHAVAVGAGEHEPLLARAAYDDYQWADGPSGVARALVPYRLAVSEATLLAHGNCPGIRRGGDGAGRPGPLRRPVHRRSLARPHAGHRGDGTQRPDLHRGTHDEAVTVQEVGERVTVVVNGAEPGEWRVRVTGDAGAAPGAWYEVEETLTPDSFLRTAYGTGDTTDDFRTGDRLQRRPRLGPRGDRPDHRSGGQRTCSINWHHSARTI